MFNHPPSDLLEILRDIRAGNVPTHNELVILGGWVHFIGRVASNKDSERFRAALRRLHSGKPLCFYDHQLIDELLEGLESEEEAEEPCRTSSGISWII